MNARNKRTSHRNPRSRWNGLLVLNFHMRFLEQELRLLRWFTLTASVTFRHGFIFTAGVGFSGGGNLGGQILWKDRTKIRRNKEVFEYFDI
ncbi:hypothetical protein M514_23516 [Trichuris suis]|uniref:Uncharacterized protein n=1 Tax=Trichuris suis TaxID=68888 RepID=A0A085N4F2_9BILA|nr:hypothetical protein M514_23516 [Trichuris suis]